MLSSTSKTLFASFLAGLGALNACAWDEAQLHAAKAQDAEWRMARENAAAPAGWQANPVNLFYAEEAWKTLCAYHKNLPASARKLHVVYVTFKDRPALPDYKERYDRILKNIREYYAAQMKANGFPPLSFKLDLDDKGKLIIHDAYVDQPMSTMTVQSSGPVSREAAKKILAAKGVDIEKEHVLIICQLPDGIGPYYGGGNSRHGTAWICDQEGLDTTNLSNTAPMPGSRYGGSVGRNASIYIGGTAHELGHSFGLPHTNTGGYPHSGRSLMGDGNATYGEELRQEGLGTFLYPSDALILAGAPIINGVEVDIPSGAGAGRLPGLYAPGAFESIGIKNNPNADTVTLTGRVRLDRPAYGLVAHADPAGHSDYDAHANGVALNEGGSFEIEVPNPLGRGRNGFFELRLSVLNCDSTRSLFVMPVWKEEQGFFMPCLAQLTYFTGVQSLWRNGKTQEALALLNQLTQQHGQEKPFREWLPVWQRALRGQYDAPAALLSAVPEDKRRISLHDVQPLKAQVGWGMPMWDVLYPSELGPVPFFIKSAKPKRFIFAHAPAVFAYDLGGAWDKFKAVFGLPIGASGSVRFSVWLDGKQLTKTGVLRDGNSTCVELDVKGAKMLEIRVDDGGNGNGGDWGIIADAELLR